MPSHHRTKKATISINEDVLEDAKAVVRKSDYQSLNAFVETAIIEMIKRSRKKEIKHQMRLASRDPLFLEDVNDIQRDFQYADWEDIEKSL